jgi:HEAT repeat protein
MHVLLHPLLVTCLAFAPPRAAVSWHATLDAALADAAARNVPLVVAVNMDGERANDEAVKTLYRDPRIVELLGHCAPLFVSTGNHAPMGPCPRAGGPVTCEEHRAAEKAVRAAYLKRSADGGYVAPEHLFVAPDGKILLSVPYQVNAAELEWCLVTAIRRLDPGYSFPPRAGARAPKRLVLDGVAATGMEDDGPPDRKELESLLAEVRSAPLHQVDPAKIVRLLRSPDKKAIDFATATLGSKLATRDDRLTAMLRTIGRVSPPEYHAVVAPFVTDERDDVRAEALVALEQLANVKSLPSLMKAWKKEGAAAVRRELIRAIASCGRADAAASKLVLELAAGDDDQGLRTAALLGTVHLEDRPKARAAAIAATTAAGSRSLRYAAAHALAVTRELENGPPLQAAAETETDLELRAAFAAAIRVFEGRPASDLDGFLEAFCAERIPRERR